MSTTYIPKMTFREKVKTTYKPLKVFFIIVFSLFLFLYYLLNRKARFNSVTPSLQLRDTPLGFNRAGLFCKPNSYETYFLNILHRFLPPNVLRFITRPYWTSLGVLFVRLKITRDGSSGFWYDSRGVVTNRTSEILLFRLLLSDLVRSGVENCGLLLWWLVTSEKKPTGWIVTSFIPL